MKRTLLLLTLMLGAGLLVTTPARADEKKAADDKAYGDWILHCAKSSNGEEACALHQKIMSADTKLPVAAAAIARHKQSHELRLAVILPLGLDIPAGVSGKAGSQPISFTIQTCVRRGCVASTEVDDKLLETLHGSEAFTTTFKMRSVTDPTTLPFSLKGLDEGLKALESR